MTSSLRTIDPCVRDDNRERAPLDQTKLPLRYDVIPATVHGLKECVMHQIRRLDRRALSLSCLTLDEEDALDDGFLMCDLSVVEAKLWAWRRMFPRIKPFYALKCNPDVMVAAVLGQHVGEVGFDCASVAEINLALKSTGGNGKRCIYANPQRAEADLAIALSSGVEALTFDGVEELRKIKVAYEEILRKWNEEEASPKTDRIARSRGPRPMPLSPEVILRILVPDEKSSVPLGEKFGAKPSDIAALAEEAIDLDLPLVGVSFHCGSGCHDPDAFGIAIRLAKEAIDVVNETKEMRKAKDGVDSHIYQHCCLLDIGGGYPGIDGGGGDTARFCGRNCALAAQSCALEKESIEKEETVSNIATVVSPLLDDIFPRGDSEVCIISEPGRYFVESAFALCSRIYCSQSDSEGIRHYYIAQGVHGVFKDVILCGEQFCPIPLRCSDHDSNCYKTGISEPHNEALFRSTVHGPSGDEFDIVCIDCLLPQLEPGDCLIFDRMGAYTLSIAAKCGRLPVRYVRRC